MRDWIDSPAPSMRQRVEHEYWCRHCREWFTVTLRLENDVGEYSGDEQCPYCSKEGCPREEMSE